MISGARGLYSDRRVVMIFFPGLAIASLVLSFNLFGDGLRDAWTTGRSKIVRAVRRRDVCGFLAFSVCEPVVHGTGPLPGEPESDS